MASGGGGSPRLAAEGVAPRETGPLVLLVVRVGSLWGASVGTQLLMLVAESVVGTLVGFTIIVVDFWRMAEQRGHGCGDHFAGILWVTAPSAPLASSSHCPLSVRRPGLACRCSSSSSMASWCCCSVLLGVLVLDDLLMLAFCTSFARGFGDIFGGKSSWSSRSVYSGWITEMGRSRVWEVAPTGAVVATGGGGSYWSVEAAPMGFA